MNTKLLAKNRKALFDYGIIDKYTAGIVLEGHEVKSIREGNVNFEGSYISMVENEPYVVNLYIGRYSKKSFDTKPFDPKRPRKLLLESKEINEISRALSEKGRTAVPLALVLSNNLIKLEIATVKGMKKYEKKQVAKEKQMEKDLQKEAKTLI